MKYAPVLVSVYDRPNHFKACVESLAQNKGAENTLLFISSDGPRNAISVEKVGAVRDYIKTIKGFKEVFSFCPRENTSGKIKSSVYKRIKSDFPRYIKTEDDNFFSPYALKYFNQGLDLFEDDTRIHAICGYIYPGYPFTNYEHIYLQCLTAWGVAYWRDKDIGDEFNGKELANEVLSKKSLFSKVNNCLPHMVPMIKSIVDGKLEANDVNRNNYIIKHNKICVFPSISLVRNMGNDGTGRHCVVDKKYENQIIADQEIQFNMMKPREPVLYEARWIVDFFGGKKAIFRNKLLFAEFNSANRFSKSLITAFLSTIRIFRLPARLYKLAKRRIT